MSLLGSIFPIHASRDREHRELLEAITQTNKTLQGVLQRMASIHDDIDLLKKEVVSLNTTVATALSTIANNLTSSSEQADVENSVAQMKKLENDITQFTANLTTPPAPPAPPPTNT